MSSHAEMRQSLSAASVAMAIVVDATSLASFVSLLPPPYFSGSKNESSLSMVSFLTAGS
jgi:hypothetical protein